MPRIDQQVIGKIELAQHSETSKEFRLKQESIVRLALHNMPDAHQFRIAAKRLELGPYLRRFQVHPSDDAHNERMMVRQFQQPPRFFERLPRLHSDASLKSVSVEF